jgi:virginiamycin A acetyltransferase
MMREFLKMLARGVAVVVVSPALLWYALMARGARRDLVLEGCSQLFALVPGLCGQYVRRAFLSYALAECAQTAVVGFGTIFSNANARLESGSYVGPYCTIGLAHVGPGALIAAGVHIPSGPRTHGIDPSESIRDQPRHERLVQIGAGAWIGNNAVVLADVGSGTVVGAGAVVTRPLPAEVIAAGVPARVIRRRDGQPADTE